MKYLGRTGLQAGRGKTFKKIPENQYQLYYSQKSVRLRHTTASNHANPFLFIYTYTYTN